MTTLPEALRRAEAWLKQDEDAETRAELSQLLAAAVEDEDARETLRKRFDGRLQFGTAGLRGRLQAGPQGMNRVLVAQAAAGLAQYLQAEAAPSIVIGYDGRKNSRIFAQDTAEIMAGAGIQTHILPRALPTPVLAFALRHLQASAAVMVTASHNPPQDNGYKVYLGGRHGDSQIIAPEDARIAACIDAVAAGDVRDLPRSTDYQRVDESIIQAYVQASASLLREKPQPLRYVYTAMHGVGRETFLQCLDAAALPRPLEVAAQAEPHPDFPTVAFPNPEEPGALDLALTLAQAEDAEFILAHDPDADRLAVAIPENGRWQALHGNILGCYLAWHMMRRAQAEGRRGCVANSLVSSPALQKMAEKMGFDYQSTLTGFKYISKVPELIFGYEEALGYLVDPDKVRDKDGISAALAFLDLMLSLKRQGQSLADYAAAFEREFGAHASGQISVQVQDLSALMSALKSEPWTELAGLPVQRWSHEPVLRCDFADGSRLLARPSGTEPKIKLYLDCSGTDRASAEQRLQALREALRAWLRQAGF